MNTPNRREGFVADEPIDAPPRGRVIDGTALRPQHQPRQQRPQPEPQPEPQPQPEPPPEPPQPQAITWPIKVRLLYKPIRDAQGDELRELTFREPTGGDINRYGNPIRIDQNGDVIIDERKMTFMMAALTGHLSPLLERMDPRDWNSCAYRLRSFFLPDPAAW